jgi:hypothetical protein
MRRVLLRRVLRGFTERALRITGGWRAVLLILIVLAVQPVSAQSLFSTRGLGVPLESIDPRSRGLGSVGIGLVGLNASMVNPAELSGIRRRGVVAALQPFYGAEELNGRDDNVAGSRFPLIHLIYPLRSRFVFGLGYGGSLDQSWSLFEDGSEIFSADTVSVRDQISAAGALAQVRISASYQLNPSVSLGLAGGVYTGGLERQVTRTFPDSAVDLVPFSTLRAWDYRAPFLGLGFLVDFANTRVSSSVTWSGELEARPREQTTTTYTYDLPLRVAVGASSLISSRLLGTASAQWSNWSDSGNYAAAGSPQEVVITARPTWEVGGGLEWEEIRTATRVFPLRLGFRFAQLPFYVPGDEPAKELAGSLGLGLRLAGDDFGPLAVADIAVERGQRTGWQSGSQGTTPDGLTENFWRLSFSVALFGR